MMGEMEAGSKIEREREREKVITMMKMFLEFFLDGSTAFHLEALRICVPSRMKPKETEASNMVRAVMNVMYTADVM